MYFLKLKDLVATSLDDVTVNRIRDSLPVEEAKILERILAILEEFTAEDDESSNRDKRELIDAIALLVSFFNGSKDMHSISIELKEIETRK